MSQLKKYRFDGSEPFKISKVSTDSKKYAEIAKQYNANVPFLRSATNSDDKAGSWDVVMEVLGKYQELGKTFDTVCLLQPTSPLRTAEDIINAYNLLEEKQADAITSVCEVDHSPLWTMTLDDSLSLAKFRALASDRPRQLLATYYRLNGAIYIRRIDYADGRPTILSNKEFATIMPREHSVDIDSELDFTIAKATCEAKN